MNPFTYLRPETVAQAAQARMQHPDARYLSGGMSLLPMMKQGLSTPTHLIDLTRIEALQGIDSVGDRLVIGAATSHRDVAHSGLVRRILPALAATAGVIGDPQVRNRGTLGGAIAHADPVADYPAAALALDALIETQRRRIDASGFFQGLFTTALEEDEIVVRVRFRQPHAAHYESFRHPGSGFAMAGVFVARFDDGVRVAVTGAADCPFRWAEAEQALSIRFDAAAVAGLAVPTDALIDDLHASAGYRAQLVRIMLGRAIHTMADSARD